MSMSHKSFAAAWTQLELRTDINQILYELIGQHNLKSSVLPVGSEELRESSLDLAVCLKVILDLQRTYQQSEVVQNDCVYLLEPSTLNAAVLHLLRMKSMVFPCSVNTAGIHRAKQSFLARALVSGLRALLLRNYKLSSDQQSHLRAEFKEAWDLKFELDIVDRFIVQQLCPALVDSLCQGSSELARVGCGEIEYRDYASCLYPLENRPGELLEPVRNTIFKTSRGIDRLKSFCILFDILWTVEAALIQLCVNSTKPTNNTKQIRPTQEDVIRLYNTRRSILNEVCNSRSPSLNAILTILPAPCARDSCICLQDSRCEPDLQTIPFSVTKSPVFNFVALDPQMGQLLDSSLSSFATKLTARKKKLWNVNGELSDFSHNLDQSMEKWYLTASAIGPKNDFVRQPRRKAYILSCPKLHPIPYDNLEGILKDKGDDSGLMSLKNNASVFEVDIECSQCEILRCVRSVRLIEPLREISTELTKSLERRASKRVDTGSRALIHDNGGETSSESHRDNSVISRGSEMMNSSERGSTKRVGSLKSLVGESTNNNGSRSVPYYTFSTDGQTLVLWYRKERSIYVYDVDADQTQSFSTEPILYAASSVRRYAILSTCGNGTKLHVYRNSDGQPVCLPHSITVPVWCISFSPNGSFVALGSDAAILVFDIDNAVMYRHKLPASAETRLDSQRIAFSLDSAKFIVATRYHARGRVLIYISECTNNTMSQQVVPSIKIPTGLPNDSGLSSVSMDLEAGFIFITAFTSQSAAALISLRKGKVKVDYLKEPLCHQIQCATQMASGSGFYLVNKQNQVYAVRGQADGPPQISEKARPWPKRSFPIGSDRMTMAMPDKDTIHLFGFNDKEWRLMMMIM